MKRIVIKLEIENDNRKGLPNELAEWTVEAYAGAYGYPPLRLLTAYWEDPRPPGYCDEVGTVVTNADACGRCASCIR
jgi:hypothetical protein